MFQQALEAEGYYRCVDRARRKICQGDDLLYMLWLAVECFVDRSFVVGEIQTRLVKQRQGHFRLRLFGRLADMVL